MVSRRFTVGIGCLCSGVVILMVALYFANPFYILDQLNGAFYCNGLCYLEGILDFIGAAAGVILMLVGVVILVNRFFPSESL